MNCYKKNKFGIKAIFVIFISISSNTIVAEQFLDLAIKNYVLKNYNSFVDILSFKHINDEFQKLSISNDNSIRYSQNSFINNSFLIEFHKDDEEYPNLISVFYSYLNPNRILNWQQTIIERETNTLILVGELLMDELTGKFYTLISFDVNEPISQKWLGNITIPIDLDKLQEIYG